MIRHSVRAPVDISRPEPPGWCDRCNMKYLHRDLSWAMDWRGPRFANLRLLVCHRCLDEPQPNGQRPVMIGPDPMPVRDPRPGYNFSQMNEPPSGNIRNSAQEILGDEQDVYWEPAVEFETGQDVGRGEMVRPYGRGPYGRGPYGKNKDDDPKGVFRYG